MALTSTVLIVVPLLTLAAVQKPKAVDPCAGLEATVRVSPTTFKHGARPALTVTVRNISSTSLRLLDIRNGRRPDLADTYYEIVVEQNRQVLKDLPRAISDPGPIETADFFVLAPGGSFEAPLSSSLDFGAVPAGQYSARARITLDPFATRGPRCSSGRTSFTVAR
jgi:hypothetical protein